MHGPAAAFRVSGHTIQQVLYPVEESRGYEATGDLWSPGYFRVTLEPERSEHPRRLDRVVGGHATRSIPRPPSAPSACGDGACSRPRIRSPGPGRPRSSCWPPTSSSSRRRGAWRTPRSRAATGDEARHDHRRLPLVHRLGTRHDDQPRGPDPAHGPPRRGRLHPAHVRPLRARRPDPQHVPGRRAGRALPHGRRDASGTSTPSTATSRRRRTAARSALLLPTLVAIVDHHLAGTRFGIGVDPADGLLRQGADGYQLTWMDAKVDDWVVTPRRGKAVEINALWYNALRLLEGWLREEEGDEPAAALAARAAERARVVQPPLLVRRRRLPLRRGRRRAGDDAACRPNQLFAISLRHPVLDRGAVAAGADGGPDPPPHAGRTSHRWPPATPTTRRRMTATSERATRPTTRARSGPGSSARSSTPGSASTPRTGRRPAACSTASGRTSTRRASAVSARSSTPRRRSRRAGASRRRGAWPRCSAHSS